MSSYNGLVSSLTLNGSTVSQTMTGTSTMNSAISASVPNKYFSTGQFAVQATQGVSGSFFVNVIGGVGGATYIIAGRTGISAVGGYPVPLIAYVGSSGAAVNYGIPRPNQVQWGVAAGTVTGFTASVFFAGEYV